jgi:hypothetical protein
MKPMLGKAKWWEKKTVENAKFKSHYKAWCVIERVSGMRPTKDGLLFDIEYVGWVDVMCLSITTPKQ